MARRLPYVQVDVFTSRPLEGNALAVLTDARGLSTDEMQAIARETNLSETTFVLPDPSAPSGAPDDLDPAAPIQTVSTGLAFAIVPFRRLATVRDLRIEWRRADAYLAGTDARFFYLVSRETVDPAAGLHARMIFYGGEDPATGSAAGCCAAWMVKHGVVAPGQAVLIEQGLEARRPSRIHVRASAGGAGATDVRVGGHVVEVARGELVF
jgi:PhzF family phenazine biosynthesis protein